MNEVLSPLVKMCVPSSAEFCTFAIFGPAEALPAEKNMQKSSGFATLSAETNSAEFFQFFSAKIKK